MMNAYHNDMYMPSYDAGDGWSWQQSWGSDVYDAMPYDQQRCSVDAYDCGWEYQSQEWAPSTTESWPSELPAQAQWPRAPGPSWCGSSAWDSSSRWPDTSAIMMTQVKMQSGASVQPAAPLSQVTQVPMASGGTAVQSVALPSSEPKAGEELLTELRLAELKRLIDRDAQALRTPTRELVPVPEGPELEPPFKIESANETSPGSSKPGDVKCHSVLVDFLPSSRDFGEMSVKAGEKVTVRYPASEDWIFGWKGWPVQEQGWIPAQNLGIGVSIKDDPSDEDVTKVDRPSDKIQDDKPKAQERAWHHHGNWWSRQRHLKVQPTSAKKDIGDVRRRPPTDPVELQKSRLAASAFAAATANKQQAQQPAKGVGRGKSGRGAPERQVRERPALSNLLDRLQKPLVVSQEKRKA
ncbi:unnamed protein product [Effrenium voratum]|uniref:SH3 domain-containing protein n=1 Tax=Effrenium voratum TaxID=2562239 RepID=A0AA36IB29_9DINO|nr:unnamed protein product [Effrenium voratum]